MSLFLGATSVPARPPVRPSLDLRRDQGIPVFWVPRSLKVLTEVSTYIQVKQTGILEGAEAEKRRRAGYSPGPYLGN